MAKTPTQLQATITANFPDNTSQAITPALLRAQQNEIATSFNYGTFLTSNTTVEAASINYCDTFAGPFNVTLPTSPAIGDMIRIRDVSGTWSTNNLSLLPGSNKIESLTGTFVCDISDANFDLVWRGGGVGWGMQFGVSLIERKPSTIQTGAFASTGGGSVGFVGRGVAPTGAFAMTGVSAVAWVGGSNVPITTFWNPLDKSPSVTLTNSNLTGTLVDAVNDFGVRGNTTRSDHRYFELNIVAINKASASGTIVGWANTTQSLTTWLGHDSTNGIGLSDTGTSFGTGGNTPFGIISTGEPTFDVGDVLGMERLVGSAKIYKNNVLALTFTLLPTGSLFPAISFGDQNDSITANFGATAFTYTPPAGATAWNT